MDKGIVGSISNMTDKLPQQQPQGISTASSMLQNPDGSGLASSSGGQTLTSGIQNPVANSAMFGNRTNGSGMMEGLAGSGLRNRIQNNQGMQNQYGIIGGAILI